VADDTRPPVAIRSLRPYATEDAFLAEERDTLTRTAVTLIGAPSRPRGVVIRFELTLNDGTPLVRGEGRVLGFQPADEHGPSSLTLRFTRLDAKSKALVDRAAALRESRPPPQPSQMDVSASEDTEPPPPLEPPGAPAEDPLASTSIGEVMPAVTEPPPLSMDQEQIALSTSFANVPLGEAEEIGIPIDVSATEPPPPLAAETPVVLPPPAPTPQRPASRQEPVGDNRDSQLERLRSRAKTLTPNQVATILAAVPRPTT
jgi:hypothetical protein